MHPLIRSLVAIVLSAAASAMEAQRGRGSTPPLAVLPTDSLYTLYNGNSSSPEPIRLVVTDSQMFRIAWDRFASAATPRPTIDFSRYHVAVVGAGFASAPVLWISLDSAYVSPRALELLVRTQEMRSGCTVDMVAVQPIQFVRIPATPPAYRFIERYAHIRGCSRSEIGLRRNPAAR